MDIVSIISEYFNNTLYPGDYDTRVGGTFI